MGQFTIQFWRVSCPSQTTLDQHLAEISSTPPSDLVSHWKGDPVLMRHLKRRGDFWEGDVLRIKNRDLPERARENGSTAPLDLAADEGLGTANAWLYHIPSRTLLFESNRDGVTSARAMEYVARMVTVAGKITLDPIMSGSAIEQYKKMAEPRRLDISFADIDGGALFHDKGNEMMKTVEKIYEDFGSPYVTLSLSMGRKPATLAKRLQNTIVDLLTGLTGDSGTITKCKVSGKLDLDGERTVLDLLENKIVDEGIADSGDRNQASFSLRMAELKEAWRRRGEEVIRLTPTL